MVQNANPDRLFVCHVYALINSIDGIHWDAVDFIGGGREKILRGPLIETTFGG